MTTRRKRLIFWVIFLISCTTLLILSSFALAIDPDSYEDDDTFSQANVIFLNNTLPQRHNFHDAGDEDWVQFYGISQEIYEIKVSNAGTNCNAVIELYETDGTTLLKGPWNWGGSRVTMSSCPGGAHRMAFTM